MFTVGVSDLIPSFVCLICSRIYVGLPIVGGTSRRPSIPSKSVSIITRHHNKGKDFIPLSLCCLATDGSLGRGGRRY
jgi:hypothetical protein